MTVFRLRSFDVLRGICAVCLFICLIMPEGAAAQAPGQVLNYRDADIRALIEDVSMMTGRTFIIDPRVTGTATVVSREPIGEEEIFEVFLSTLRVNGFTAVPTPSGAYRIVPQDMAAMDANPVARGGTGDHFVTEVIRVHHIDAMTALNTIKPIVSGQGRVTSHRNSSFLIVVDYASNVERVRQVLAGIDKDASVIRTVPLQNTSATEMASIVGALAYMDGPEDNAATRINAIPVESSNTLLLRGDPQVIERILPVITDLDTNSQTKDDIKVIYLKHAAAEELVPMLELVSNSIARQVGAGDPAAAQTGSKVSIGFHKGTNALIISAEPNMMQALEGVIRQIDIRRAQVLIEAIIVEVSDSAARELGLQYVLSGSRGSDVPFIAANYSDTAPNILALTGAVVVDQETSGEDSDAIEQLQSRALDSLLGLNGLTAGFAGITDGGTLFGVILNALDQDTGSNILSTPSIMTLDNESSSIIVGQEIPITTGEALGSDNVNPFRTIDRQDVGVQLEVKPQINEGNTIKLFIRQEVSDVFGPVSANFTELVTNKRENETTILAEDGEIIVLGGLIEQDERSTVEKVPLLGDIPLLGRAFRSEGKSKQKTNLMVFLRPTVVRDVNDVRAVTGRKYDFMKGQQTQSSINGSASMDEFLSNVIGSGQMPLSGMAPVTVQD